MQTAIQLHGSQIVARPSVRDLLSGHMTWSNAARIGLAVMAVIAIPLDVRNHVFSPAPNWPLIVTEPVILLGFLRCTLGSLR
jgi:hypothetical protein